MILLNKAHYWVLKQHTDSTPQLTLFEKSYHWTVILFSLLPRSRGNPINYTSVLCVMQIRFPWFAPQSFFPKLLQPKEPHRWTVILFSLLPRSRGNPINYTSVSFAMQIRFPWFAPQSFFPKILHNHTRQLQIPSSKKPKHYTIENLSKPLPTRRNTEEILRFFLLAAATHTTIQMPKHPCNPK